ncbi:MAG: metal-dependent hydrolase [Alcanivorax sp.]|nr:metal-dependent hydrolase [Alcanivorax sp.]
MDSLTQIALGSAVGHAVLGRQIGRRAILWGAALGTLPDLDVLIPVADPVSAFIYHRSFSHSLLIMALATPLLVWLARRLHPDTARHTGRWALLIFLVLATHTLLDALTVYGTQLFWPLTNYPVSGSVIFIIDPLYTLPLLIGVGIALFSRSPERGSRANTVGLVLSCLYLVWAGGMKWHTEQVVRHHLADHNVSYERILTTPGAFNTLIWRILVMDGDRYYEGFYSLLDGQRTPTFEAITHQPALLTPLADNWAVQELKRFTHGFYSVEEEDGTIVISDLRMGMRGTYVFRFGVGTREDDVISPVATPLRMPYSFSSGHVGWLFQRMLDPLTH